MAGIWDLIMEALAETHDGATLVAFARYYRSQPEIGCPIGCF
jgi:hypothetical protein